MTPPSFMHFTPLSYTSRLKTRAYLKYSKNGDGDRKNAKWLTKVTQKLDFSVTFIAVHRSKLGCHHAFVMNHPQRVTGNFKNHLTTKEVKNTEPRPVHS